MEARIYYNDGAIEAHRQPELVGYDLVPSPIPGVSGAPHNDLDRIPDIIEKFTHDSDGFYFERVIVLPRGGVRKINGGRCCIVPAGKLPDVKLILLDGEQVWPDEAAPKQDRHEFDGLFEATNY